ncbi:hypothetical protein CapIbe_024230, partial [Capra ibex]
GLRAPVPAVVPELHLKPEGSGLPRKGLGSGFWLR